MNLISMKRSMTLLLSILLATTFFSCNSDDEGSARFDSWYPVEFQFYVQNGDGVDLLNYDSSYYAGNDFQLEYDGKIYHVERTITDEEGYNLLLAKDKGEDKYCVYFGKLNGYKDYDDTFILRWNDGQVDKIRFYRKITGNLQSDDKWFFNGEDTGQDTQYGTFTITR